MSSERFVRVFLFQLDVCPDKMEAGVLTIETYIGYKVESGNYTGVAIVCRSWSDKVMIEV